MREKLLERFKEIKSLLSEDLKQKVNDVYLDGTVLAVDSGTFREDYFFGSLFFIKPAGVVFSLKEMKVVKKIIGSLVVKEFFEFSYEDELLEKESSNRIDEEISFAKNNAKKGDFVLFDGSLLYKRKQSKAFLDFLEFAKGNDIYFAGVVKRSFGREFSKRFLGKNYKDELVAEMLLDEGEMTHPFPYSKELEFSCFYIKPSKDDFPIRVEVYNGDVEVFASLILKLSFFSHYAVPYPLLLADNLARIRKEDLAIIRKTYSFRDLERSVRRILR